MAFNPLHTFRKHQKVVFAGLTILCMLTFVLSSGMSGRGDFFGEMAYFFGMRTRAAAIAHFNGKDVEYRDLVSLREQRKIANQFMFYAVLRTVRKVVDEATGPRSPLDANIKTFVVRILRNQLNADPEQTQQYLKIIANLAKDKPSQLSFISLLGAALQAEWRLTHPMTDELYPGSRLYFGGSTTAQGLVDFMVWEREADRLGIQLTDADVDAAIARETLDRLDRSDYAALRQQLGMRRSEGAADDIVGALAAEFRVRLAQLTVLGLEPQMVNSIPAFVTPYELYEFYRKNRTEASIEFLDIPVQHFLSQVKEKASQDQLREVYEKYKNLEYAPDRDTPGFKLPRRVKVEWISASVDSAYYLKMSRELLVLDEGLLPVLTQIPGNRVLQASVDLVLLDEYSKLKDSRPEYRLPSWPQLGSTFPLYTYAYFRQATSAAALLGQIAGAAAIGGVSVNTLDPVATGQFASAYAKEAKPLAASAAEVTRSRVPLAGVVLAATSASPVSNALSLGGLWHYAATVKQYLPLDLVKSELRDNIRQKIASDLVKNTVTNFKQELEKVKNQPAQAEKLVKEQAARHGWKHGSSKELHNKFTIATDPGLASLKEGLNRGSGRDDPKGKQFAEDMFADASSFFSGQRTGQPKVYTPAEPFEGNQATYLYWRTEDQPPKVLTYEHAQPEVEAAWRFAKARELAQAEADKIAKQAEATKGDAVRTLTEASTRFSSKLHSLPGISRLIQKPSPRADLGPQYEPFTVPDNVIEYPRPDFVDKVLDLKQKGDVTIVTDVPQSHYFVVTLVERYEPKTSDFYVDVVSSRRKSDLLTLFEEEKRKQYREETMKRLREEHRARLTDDQSVIQSFDERGGSSE